MKIKNLFRKLWENKQIRYSIDIGLFLAGILICLYSNHGEISIRGNIGPAFILFAYILFPFMSKDKKEKLLIQFCMQVVLVIATLLIAYKSLNIYVTFKNGAKCYQEILASIGLVWIFAYFAYLLIGFIKAFYTVSLKCMSFVTGSVFKEGYSKGKKIIEAGTASIATITALVASVSALVISIKEFIN